MSAERRIGLFTGARMDLPPGKHPLDWYIAALVNMIGHRKAAIYLGVEPMTDAQFEERAQEFRAQQSRRHPPLAGLSAREASAQ